MNHKHIVAIAVAAFASSPATALADDYFNDWNRPAPAAHHHTASCNHAPGGQPSQPGRYEVRTVRQWVPGYYAKEWVPQTCHRKRQGYGVKCFGGFYRQQWVPGRYETRQEQVWVPHRPYRPYRPAGYGYHQDFNDQSAYQRDEAYLGFSVGDRHGQARVGVRVGGAL